MDLQSIIKRKKEKILRLDAELNSFKSKKYMDRGVQATNDSYSKKMASLTQRPLKIQKSLISIFDDVAQANFTSVVQKKVFIAIIYNRNGF